MGVSSQQILASPPGPAAIPRLLAVEDAVPLYS